MPIAIPWKFAAKINVREKRFELDFPAMTKDFELTSVRYVLEDQKKLFHKNPKVHCCITIKKYASMTGLLCVKPRSSSIS